MTDDKQAAKVNAYGQTAEQLASARRYLEALRADGTGRCLCAECVTHRSKS